MNQLSHFDTVANQQNTPLASRLRPQTLADYVGQQHLLGQNDDGTPKILRQMIEQDKIPSMIFWGPPGVGKTTLARIIANTTKAEFADFSAATGGIKEIKTMMATAEQSALFAKRTIIFVDEIHRFNKAQQDAFLPFVEKGSIILIGATTENPSFEVNSALLSRCKVFVLHSLTTPDLITISRKALATHHSPVECPDSLLESIAAFANGDARTLINTLEMILTNCDSQDGKLIITEKIVEQCINKKFLLYDKNGEEHYNIISALHKSMRNSDVQASIYWLARMLEAGEDPLYVARRITRFASEDIGMADSRALEISVAAFQACHLIGMPECSVHLTHAVTYCALAPKSNALYLAYGKACADAQNTLAEPVPLHIRNAPTKLMKDIGYGKGYEYSHDYANSVTNMQCLPDSLASRQYYRPTNQGAEKRVAEHMENIEKLRKKP